MADIAPRLATRRLVLTGHHPDDLDDLAPMWAHPAVYERIGGQPRSREEVWIRLLRSIGQWTHFGYGSWVLRERDGGAFVGEIGLLEARRAIDPPLDARPEMGWTLAPAMFGKGYALEALTAILDWSDRRGLAQTCCIIDPGNAPSLKLADRIGYRVQRETPYHGKPILVLERG